MTSPALISPQRYTYRWNRQGRKGHTCTVLARSKARASQGGPCLNFGIPAGPRFNSICVKFDDGYTMVTSGNSIRKVR